MIFDEAAKEEYLNAVCKAETIGDIRQILFQLAEVMDKLDQLEKKIDAAHRLLNQMI